MNENESVEGESAYGSETSLMPEELTKNDSLTTQESTGQKRNRCKELKCKVREYMVLEAVIFLILVFLLITCYFIIIQNRETQRMILNIQSQLNAVQKHIRKNTMNSKEEADEIREYEPENTKKALEEDVKEVRIEPDVGLEANSKETHVPPIIPAVSTNSTLKRFNAASLIAGSRIDTSLSSSSNLNPSIGYDQSSLVLVDRPEPPANKAWCTYEKNPVLTVNLGKYNNPTAVSYQHSKWDQKIPDDAPNEYSVEACFDNHCINRKPLFSNCEYNQHGLQEQFCNKTSSDSIDSPVRKLQFRLQKNHGNTKRTCVSLVRVYSETEVLPEQKLRSLEDATTCLDLRHSYHNNSIMYKFFSYKNCYVLHSKGCCQECPECCEECEIQDINPKVVEKAQIVGLLLLLILPVLLSRCSCVREQRSE